MPNAPPNQEASDPLPPAHISYSQYTDWLKCGKAYELKRILGLAEAPAWWSIGGKGVHSATENYDRMLLEGDSHANYQPA